MTAPQSLALTVFTKLIASHSLQGFETPHFHLWKLAIEFKAALPIKADRLIDLIFLENEIQKVLAPYQNTFLNHSLEFSPTSENLAQWLWKKLATQITEAPLHSITVTLCNLEGESSGAARIE